MASMATVGDESPMERLESAATDRSGFRLESIMRQGTPSSIPETWSHYSTLAEARLAVKSMYHDDRVLRAFIVTDEAPPHFVEWVER
jgi:hypothetical protein